LSIDVAQIIRRLSAALSWHWLSRVWSRGFAADAVQRRSRPPSVTFGLANSVREYIT